MCHNKHDILYIVMDEIIKFISYIMNHDILVYFVKKHILLYHHMYLLRKVVCWFVCLSGMYIKISQISHHLPPHSWYHWKAFNE
jgi:hypothetical protein